MNDKRAIEEFHFLSKSNGLDYLVIGGFAASFWGEPRFTADVDFVICETSYELAKKILESAGYKLLFLHPKKSFAHFGGGQNSGMRIDFMLVNGKTWNELKASSTTGDFGVSEPLPVVSARHLIAMKIHAAAQLDRKEFFKDLLDVVAIMSAQSITFEDLEKEGILSKHGNENIKNQLLTILGSKR